MLTREGIGSTYKAGCCGAPPPLHVYSEQAEHAAWHPLRRPAMMPHHPGPELVTIPAPPGQLLGDDPTDPAAQTMKRTRTTGMVARLNFDGPGYSAVAGGGVRL